MNKLISLICLTKRAGKLIVGFDLVKQALLNNQIYVIFHSNDISDKTLKEIKYYCNKEQVCFYKLNITQEEIQSFIGKKGKVLGVSDLGLSKQMHKLISSD